MTFFATMIKLLRFGLLAAVLFLGGCAEIDNLRYDYLQRPMGKVAVLIDLSDQHAYLRLDPGSALAPGDLVCLGISHPCTTLDKWRVIPVLDEQDRVIDAVHTFF